MTIQNKPSSMRYSFERIGITSDGLVSVINAGPFTNDDFTYYTITVVEKSGEKNVIYKVSEYEMATKYGFNLIVHYENKPLLNFKLIKKDKSNSQTKKEKLFKKTHLIYFAIVAVLSIAAVIYTLSDPFFGWNYSDRKVVGLIGVALLSILFIIFIGKWLISILSNIPKATVFKYSLIIMAVIIIGLILAYNNRYIKINEVTVFDKWKKEAVFLR